MAVDVTIAAKILLEGLENSSQIILGRKTLDGGDSLTAVTLLTSDVDVVCRLSIVVTSIGEGIYVSKLFTLSCDTRAP